MNRILVSALFIASLPFPSGLLAAEPVFREPFTLQLRVDQQRVYEQAFPKVPFIHEGTVYLFKDDKFGVRLGLDRDSVTEISYVPVNEKADLDLRLTQNINGDGTSVMLLVITNHTSQTVFVDALMTVPDRKNILKTTILPIKPGLTNYESWPHPIVQLALKNIRVQQ